MQGYKERSGDNLLPAVPDSSDTTPSKADHQGGQGKKNNVTTPSIPGPSGNSGKALQGGQGKKDDTRPSERSPAGSQAQDIEKPLFLAESVRDPVDIKLSMKFNSPTNILG